MSKPGREHTQECDQTFGYIDTPSIFGFYIRLQVIEPDSTFDLQSPEIVILDIPKMIGNQA